MLQMEKTSLEKLLQSLERQSRRYPDGVHRPNNKSHSDKSEEPRLCLNPILSFTGHTWFNSVRYKQVCSSMINTVADFPHLFCVQPVYTHKNTIPVILSCRRMIRTGFLNQARHLKLLALCWCRLQSSRWPQAYGLMMVEFKWGLEGEEGEMDLDRWMVCQRCFRPKSLLSVCLQRFGPVTPSRSRQN